MNSDCNLIMPPHLYCLAGPKSFWETSSRRSAGGNGDINVSDGFITFVRERERVMRKDECVRKRLQKVCVCVCVRHV